MLSSFPLQHDDFVHDIAFDFYGKRIATCSSDQRIRVWEKKQKAMASSGETEFEWDLQEEQSKNLFHSAAV